MIPPGTHDIDVHSRSIISALFGCGLIIHMLKPHLVSGKQWLSMSQSIKCNMVLIGQKYSYL